MLAAGSYVILRTAYGRTRYYSVVRQGRCSREVWTETLALAERFDCPDDALDRALVLPGAMVSRLPADGA